MPARAVLTLLLLLLTPVFDAPALAATRRVPADHPTIQEAVDHAQSGDLILVEAGDWAPFKIEGKEALGLRGEAGTRVTASEGPAIEVTNSGTVGIFDFEIVAGSGGIAARTYDTTHMGLLRCRVRGGTLAFLRGIRDVLLVDTDVSGAEQGVVVYDPDDPGAVGGAIQVVRGEFTNLETGIAVSDASTVLLDKVRFSFLSGLGLQVQRALDGTSANPGVLVDGCSFEFVGDGQNIHAAALSIEGAPSVAIRRSRILDVEGVGVRVGPGTRAVGVERTELARVKGWGVDLDTGDGSSAGDRFVFNRCAMQDVGGGVWLRARGRLEMDRSTFRKVTGTAVYAGPPAGRTLAEVSAVFRRCRVEEAGEQGLALYADNCLVERCRLSDTGSTSLTLFGDGNTCRRTRMTNAKGYGVYLSGNDLTFDRNVLTEIVGGVTCTSTGATLTRNRVTGGAGVTCGSSTPGNSDIVVLRNVLRATVHGIVTTFHGGLVERNRIIDTQRTGLSCNGSGTRFVRNQVLRSGDNGIEAETAEFLFEGNRASGSGRCDYREESEPTATTNGFQGNRFGSQCFDD